MRILQVLPYRLSRPGGVQQIVISLTKYLQQHGHTVHLLAPTDTELSDIPNVHYLGKTYDFYMNGTYFECTTASFSQTKKVLKNIEFDIVHLHEPLLPFVPLQVFNIVNTPVIATLHATMPDNYYSGFIKTTFKYYIKHFLTSLNQVIAISHSPLKYVLGLAPDLKYKVLPLWVDISPFQAKNETFTEYQDGKTNILFIGRLDERKGAIYLLKAFKQAQKKNTNLRLIIVGDGQQKDFLQNYVYKHNLSDVVFTGVVSEQDKARWYATCDVFCSPALYGESFGLVLVEAMASGKPVIATNISGYNEVITGKGAELLVPPAKIKPLKRLILRLAKNKDERLEFGRWGANHALQFTPENLIPQVIRVYEEVLRREE